ncbi:rhodanese-like domain-containing protein [Aliiglaciecola lipolytica]|uniref:Phage shock protein E n=1 Tax=Aliiglaciecola lipolytica E3 TaxID=1127673 RepID=K6YZF6_9ALTE|nr:rhodanese-like domain-containing protein [Aliiglaciecola lipolytica]GAC16600.1 phage shock protein E [Aliiglaciecola lipolytica E3]
MKKQMHSLIPIFTLLLAMLFCPPILAETVWIDVRSEAEYKLDNIAGDMRITHTDIVEQVSKQYPDKNTEIHLYCRSGGRAGKAQEALQQAGYNNVKNAGGIDDAREERSIVDK